MTEPTPEPPPAPDGSTLTPEEWDAVRRLRAERPAAPQPPDAPPAAEPPVFEPPVFEPPVSEPPVSEPPLAAQSPAPAPAKEPAPAHEPPAAEAPPRVTRPAASRRPLSGRKVPAIAAAVVLAVATAVLAALVGLKVSDNSARNNASTDALAAATSGVATVLSYNYRSLDADFAKAEALLTPKFRKLYDATTAKGVKPLAAKYKAVSTAQVEAAGGISATPTKATVLVFVSQQVTNSQLSAPRLDRSRIQVELVKTHGHWLIDKLTPL